MQFRLQDMLCAVLLTGFCVFVFYAVPNLGMTVHAAKGLADVSFYGFPFSNFSVLTPISAQSQSITTEYVLGTLGNLLVWLLFWSVLFIARRYFVSRRLVLPR